MNESKIGLINGENKQANIILLTDPSELQAFDIGENEN